MKIFFKYAVQKATIIRSIKVSLFVGTILALINHYDEILKGELTSTSLFQIILTYLVPYLVATNGSASHARYLDQNKLDKN